MDALSLHLCFQLVEDPIASEECWKILYDLPSKCIDGSVTTADVITVSNDRILVSSCQDGSHVVMHVYKHGLVTIDIQFVGREPFQKELLENIKFSNIKRIENKIKTAFGDKCQYTRVVPSRLKRGEVCPYFLKGDDKLYEFEYSLKLLTEVDSKWQNVKIYDTDMFGAMLVLDNEINEAEIDDDYNDTLFRPSCNSFQDKNVLILGCGGGITLQYVLGLSPKYVVAVEIDEEVFKACGKYMKNGTNKLEGPNYKVLIEDWYKVLQDYQRSGEQFDYVVNDLSEYVINSTEAHVNDVETSTHILTESLKVMTQDGKYLSRGCGLSDKEFPCLFERDIIKHTAGLTFEKFIVDIPIFNEKYCLYEVTRKK